MSFIFSAAAAVVAAGGWLSNGNDGFCAMHICGILLTFLPAMLPTDDCVLRNGFQTFKKSQEKSKIVLKLSDSKQD